ncbi:hypothetical protein ALC53_12464 [Atta colombica]|uniref:Uncharacterized protein n=1 Tax=Atta colombica TaxID=520822 RepID=A0A195AYY5_9HYME|nr:hypothetical protein ALC53_12464 [Atta colombica]
MAYTACLRACMATYRKLRRPGDGEAEIGERSRRRKLNEDEEDDAEEAAVHERVTGERGKTRTDHEEATYDDAQPLLEGRKGGRASFGTGPSS